MERVCQRRKFFLLQRLAAGRVGEGAAAHHRPRPGRARAGKVAQRPVATLAATAGKWWRAYALRRERNAAVRELRALDDRTLKDIGINRCEIEWVVDGQDDTRLRDATIAANRSPRRDPAARTSVALRPEPSGRQLIKKHAA